MYDFHLADVAAFILERQAKLVALQFPEGLVTHVQDVVEELQRRTGASFVVLADPCFGACDVNLSYHEYADALVHFGHAEIPALKTDPGVMFVEVNADYDVLDLVPSAVERLCMRIGLVTTAQHLDKLEAVRHALEKQGKKVFVGKGDRRIKHPGQVLGCNASAATAIAPEVDCFLFVGSGDFHPLAVALATKKPVLVLDPFMRQVRDLEELRERILRQRHGAIAQASEAHFFGILVSSKPGQKRYQLAHELEGKLRLKGKKALVLIENNIDPESLMGYGVEAFVSTACPRLAIDDYLRFKKPIITPKELEVVLGERKWEDYEFDSILE
jgi:2-(3-amino-3-carboxypropyl)histidine synthase